MMNAVVCLAAWEVGSVAGGGRWQVAGAVQLLASSLMP